MLHQMAEERPVTDAVRRALWDWRERELTDPNELALSPEAASRLGGELGLPPGALPASLYGLLVYRSWSLPSGFALEWTRPAERQPRNSPRVTQNHAGAPPALLPPYTDMPGDVSGRETASSAVRAGRRPFAHVERALRHHADRILDTIGRTIDEALAEVDPIPPNTVIPVSADDLDRMARMPSDLRREYERGLWDAYTARVTAERRDGEVCPCER